MYNSKVMELDQSLFPILKTKRLILRPLLESDANEIFLLRSDEQINKYVDRKRSKTLDDALDFIKTISEKTQESNLKYWAITIKEYNTLIGTICLFDESQDHEICEIGFELLNEFQGQGIMYEAANSVIEYGLHSLGFEAIKAHTHKENQKSIALLHKLNFNLTRLTLDSEPNLVVFLRTKNQESTS